ncbi:MAG: DUF3253 domain-containing protein [Oscillatoriales cyanobacterium C42_A2020_001]|nr:DUF3253 domain-containing protein [Leptolyngbyaceae cyanobacterium C42_A2020_001]
MIDRALIRQTILEKVQQRGLDKTICPSEVARALGGEAWRSLMDEVRSVGQDLVNTGLIEVTQKGNVVDIRTVKGPIRFKITQKGLEFLDMNER